ncbi:hypothetical protein F5Y03DRAFT_339789 [Xylaria venustula]|nr:hypothetical protein F5Y03DRAFT_339789 [Xylaria venustula]
MCYPLTHLCRVCQIPVRAEEPHCRGLCFIQCHQDPYVVDEYCVHHSNEGYDASEFIANDESLYPDMMTTMNETLTGETQDEYPAFADAAYAEDVSDYLVPTSAPDGKQGQVADWLTTANEAPITEEFSEDLWMQYWSPTLDAEFELVNRQLDNEGRFCLSPEDISIPLRFDELNAAATPSSVFVEIEEVNWSEIEQEINQCEYGDY